MDIHRCRFVDYTPHVITAIAFSHESQPGAPMPVDARVAVGRSNGDVEIWNPHHNWSHEITLSGSSGRSIEGICWSVRPKESPRLFLIGGSTSITEWDLFSGTPVTNYDCNAGIIWSIDINASKTKLAVGCDDGLVAIVDISGGFSVLEHEMICQRQDSRVLSLQWNADKNLIGGCADGRIRAWSASGDTKGRIISTVRVDKSKSESTLVWLIVVLPKKKQFVSGDSTGLVKFWDLETFSLLQTYKVHDADILCLATDFYQEKIFSAGIDRKIHQFNLMTSKSTVKWVHNGNRLLHANDIRTMAIYESKGYDILVSGGVERSLVLQSAVHFMDGKYKKITINQQLSNVVVLENHQLVVMFQDQTIKFWRIQDNGKNKLVSKLVLADEGNICGIAVNADASLLVVARPSLVRVFELIENSDKDSLKVVKFRDDKFDSLVLGAKQVRFCGENEILLLSPQEEIFEFKVDLNTRTIDVVDEFEAISGRAIGSNRSSGSQYSNATSSFVVSPNKDKLVISRFNGAIEIYPLTGDRKAYLLTKQPSRPALILFSSNEKLIIVSEQNQVYEFNVAGKDSSLLTAWLRRNSEFLPHQFLSLEDPSMGGFFKNEKLWVYGSLWVAFFDFTQNIPIDNLFKNVAQGKKRHHDGAAVLDEAEVLEEDSTDAIEAALKKAQIDRLRSLIQNEEGNGDDTDSNMPFWLTQKYKNIVKVDSFGDDGIIVIERPQFSLPSAPAFGTPKFRI